MHRRCELSQPGDASIMLMAWEESAIRDALTTMTNVFKTHGLR
jgi:hypothetical protein